MKKTILFIVSVITILALAACSNGSNQESKSNQESTETKESEAATSNTGKELGKTLIAYFSVPETQDPDNMTQEEENSVVVIDGKVLGNTEYVAQVIEEKTGGDVFRIEPKTPYPTDHEELVDIAKEEQNDDVRPTLSKKVANLDEYDTVFLGYPNWWGDMPMILYSFLDDHDLSNKRIIPYNTHGGSGLSNTVESIIKEEPQATVEEDAYTVSRDDVQNSKTEIQSWVESLE